MQSSCRRLLRPVARKVASRRLFDASSDPGLTRHLDDVRLQAGRGSEEFRLFLFWDTELIEATV